VLDTATVCAYCGKPADGTKRDMYGEHVLRRPIVVCGDCDDDLQREDGPWNEWGD
jgi:hypothetical protein